jgi:hypothetical protein
LGGDVAQFGRRGGSVWEEMWRSLGGEVTHDARRGGSIWEVRCLTGEGDMAQW